MTDAEFHLSTYAEALQAEADREPLPITPRIEEPGTVTKFALMGGALGFVVGMLFGFGVAHLTQVMP